MPGSHEGVTQNGVHKEQGRAIPRWEIDCRNGKKHLVKIGEERTENNAQQVSCEQKQK